MTAPTKSLGTSSPARWASSWTRTAPSFIGDLADLAACIRGERKPAGTLEEEVRVQKWLLKACGMM